MKVGHIPGFGHAIEIDEMIYSDYNTAKFLNISYGDYVEIISSHGAIRDTGDEYWFQNVKDVERAIKELEPYYILAKLTR